MMDNRKRPLDGISSPSSANDTPSKRLQVDSPKVNGAYESSPSASRVKRDPSDANDDDDDDDDEGQNPAYKGLDAFRKEAIYRQMLESRRDLTRANRKINTLSKALADIEDRTGAFNHFWDLLVEDVRILFQKEDTLDEHRSALMNVIPFTAGQPSKSAFSASIQERATAIKAVLTRLAAIAPQSQSPDVAGLQARCHQLAEEASSLRQQSLTAQDQLQKTTDELESLSEQLRRAERRSDRLQSRTVLLSERPSTKMEEEAERAKQEAAAAEHRAAKERLAAANQSEGDSGEGSAAATNGHNAASQEELDHLTKLAQSRLEEAEQLRQEVTGLRQECERLQLDLHRIPDDRTRETTLYRDLHGHFTHAQQEFERLQGSFTALEAENTDLREKRNEYQENAAKDASKVAEGLRGQLKSRDADVSRLRAQRDELNGELTEKKARETVKLAQVEEMKQLAASKDKRIDTLRSEVRRLQMSLAAQQGNTSLVQSLKSEGVNDDEIGVIASLQERLKAAVDASDDLQRQLDARGSSTTEQDLSAKMSSMQKELDELKEVLQGAASGEEAAEKVKHQQLRIEQLQGELTAANESTNALCDEIEKLSKAYSDMDQQASSKVMDLTKMEEKVLRLTTEKAKADNKYFAAMRAKDALENDRRAVLRTVERQVQVIERYAEAEQHFSSELASHEREVTSLRNMITGYTARITELERDLKTSRIRDADSQQCRINAEERLQACVAEAEQEKARRVRIEEQFNKMERDLEKAKKQAASASAAAAASGKSNRKSSIGDSETDYLQALLRCSSCKDRYRDKIITKCLHTFCTQCIEARIQTRQRKCPHCASSFATSDVQPLYLQ
ncbi:unnamed protein product [Sympodiomycopsis kandeliae]